MKLLSDFDGVWTYPDEEGAAHGAALDAALIAVAGESDREAARDWIAGARYAVRAEPTRWGWAVAGRLSAFADEDPFAEQSALLHYLHVRRTSDPLAGRLCAAIEATGDSLPDFGGRAHTVGVKQVEASRGPGITVAAADAGRRMLAGGVEIVVVSNSTTDKLARWFAHAKVPARVHPENMVGQPRLRGSAQKFVLDAGRDDAIALGGMRIDVARSLYETLLREEAPDAVVGDVFSIDLALPLALKRREPSWRHVRLFWLVHPYAPARMRAEVAKLPAGEVEALEGGLPAVAQALLG
ncbi:MAG: hypothetical protein ABL977_01600 [Candidatus Eisenbacteria bacterium]